MMQSGAPQIYIFILASVVFVIGAIFVALYGVETKGRSVEAINK